MDLEDHKVIKLVVQDSSGVGWGLKWGGGGGTCAWVQGMTQNKYLFNIASANELMNQCMCN